MYSDIIYVCLVLLPNITAVYHQGTLHETHNDIVDTKQHTLNSYIKNHELEYCDSVSDTKHHKVRTKSDKKAEKRVGEVLFSVNKEKKDDKNLEQEKYTKEAVFKHRKTKNSKTCDKKYDDKVEILYKKTDDESEFDKRAKQSDETDLSKSCKKSDTKLDKPDKTAGDESAVLKSDKKEKGVKPNEPKSDKNCRPEQESPKQESPKPESPKQEGPKQDSPKQETPKQESPKQETTKQESPKKVSPKKENPKKEIPKQESPKQESPKQESPKQESSKQESPKEESTKPCLVSPSEKAEIANTCYMKELICDNVYASELTYDRAGRRLFFAVTTDDPKLSGRAYYDINKETLVKIPGVYKTKATGVDDKTGVVYFGSSDGLYEYNSKNNNATSIGFKSFNIKKLAMRYCVMCMIVGCKRKIYTLEPEIDYIHKVYIARRIGHWEDVQQVEIDTKKRLHITVRDMGLFCLDKHGNTILNSDLSEVDLLVYDGINMFGIVAKQMWLIDCKRGSAKKYAELDFVPESMIFYENDLFISTCNKIYHLRRC